MKRTSFYFPSVFISVLIFSYFLSSFSYAKANCLDMHVINSAPMGFINEDGSLLGSHVEFLERLEQVSGFCIEIQLMPFSRILRSLKNGDHDGGLLFRVAKSDRYVEYVALTRTIQTIVLPKRGIKINNYDALNQLIIGVVRGIPLNNNFDVDNKLNIVELSYYEQVVGMFNKGRIDALAGAKPTLLYYFSKFNDIENSVDIDNSFVLGTKEQWFQMSKKSKNLDKIPKLKRAIKQLIKDGEYDRILRKYHEN